MSIVVYWLHDSATIGTVTEHKEFTELQLTDALAFCQRLRNGGARHVCLSSENPNSVGKPGVDSVQDGRTPDGHEYGWKKRRV
jgi:hypothetical protein